MEKKKLKFYEAPMMEVVEMETSVSLLAGSGGTNADGFGQGDGTFDD